MDNSELIMFFVRARESQPVRSSRYSHLTNIIRMARTGYDLFEPMDALEWVFMTGDK